jgi:radical SAM family uncharacterized protein/radical SAM-linked protein
VSSPVVDHPYATFVAKVQKPARYLGGEFGSAKKPWDAVQARVCLAFPDIYDIGMSHLGFKILYKILNDDPRTLAERCYTPWIDMQDELRARKVPLVSLESARPLSDFDVVGFSLQFELTYTNVLTMLDLGGVPLRACDRGESDPLIMAGGPTATHPEPLAAFLDAVVIGDGEQRATEIALLWTKLRGEGVPRAERLVALSRIPGVYVPSLYERTEEPRTGLQYVSSSRHGAPLPVVRALVADLNDFPFPDDGPVGGPEAIFDRMSIEIARGCTEGCRFCQAGMIYRPVRERDPDQIVDTVMRAIDKSGYDEVSLTSLSTADHSCIAPLIEKVSKKLTERKVSLGVSSLRAYGLDEPVLDDIQRVRASGITFAPEAGSQRMRDVVNKNVTEEQLMTTAERVFSRGWNAMKLYFMIGLPTEQEADVREIVRVGARAREVGKRIKRDKRSGGPASTIPRVTVSVSTHVPKPHTPFQWCAMDTAADVRAKQAWLKEEARATTDRSGGVDLRMHASEGSWLEGVFARGDYRLADVLERAYRDGARFDSWEDQLDIARWERAFAAEGIEPARYLGTLPVSAKLPWSHIDVGLEEGFLAREYRKALKDRLSPPCGKPAGAFIHATNLEQANADARKLVCYDCGVACDLGQMREERLVYLKKLGAELPRVVAAKPEPEPPAAKTARPGPPKHAFQEGRGTAKEAPRYRLVYEKVGPTAFLSHLDLIRALPRTFRRLGLPLRYTGGFHPKPDMVFGPALSLGVATLAEAMEIKLEAEVPVDGLAEALTAASPEGLHFVSVQRMGPRDPGVNKVLDAASYAVGVPRSAMGEAELSARLEAFTAAPSIVVMRSIEGLGKKVDVKAFTRSVSLATEPDSATRAALARAGFVGDLIPLRVEVDFSNGGAVKIGEVMEALSLGGAEIPFRAVRWKLGRRAPDGEIIAPSELDRLRPPANEATVPLDAASAPA